MATSFLPSGTLNMRKAARTAWALAAVLGAGIFESWAQEREGASGRESEQLGEVNFSVSCNEAAQREFNRAMALFHSFWFDPAIKSFQKVLEQDPACGM